MERYEKLLRETDLFLRNTWNYAAETVYPFVVRADIDPNDITTLGGITGALAGYCIAQGRFNFGRFLLTSSLGCDVWDGWLARREGKESQFGAYLDSLLDRSTEVCLLTGMSIHGQKQNWQDVHFLAEVARPLVLAPAEIRMFADQNGIEVPKFDVGSRAVRMGLFTLCLAYPYEEVWKKCLLGMVITSGITTMHRASILLRSGENNKGEPIDRNGIVDALVQTVGERFAWQLMDSDFAQFAGDSGLIKNYARGKKDLIMGNKTVYSQKESDQTMSNLIAGITAKDIPVIGRAAQWYLLAREVGAIAKTVHEAHEAF